MQYPSHKSKDFCQHVSVPALIFLPLSSFLYLLFLIFFLFELFPQECLLQIHILYELKIPKAHIKTLMRNIHQNAIKYLTYSVLNKRKLDNKQTPIPPP